MVGQLLKTHSLITVTVNCCCCRLDTDILFGRNCGFKTLLVLTGAHGIADVEERAKKEETKSMVPDFYIESVGHMRDLLKN